MNAPPERQLRPSVIYAGVAIRRTCTTRALMPAEALAHIRQGDAQVNAFDYASAFALADEFGWDVFSDHPDTTTAFRATLSNLVPKLRPMWMQMLPLGRARVLGMVGDDVRQTLEIAQLVGYDPDTIAWWDRLAGMERRLEDDERLAFGRAAEQRAYDRERATLAGTGLQVRWVAIEDNTAGYDIQSWRLSGDPDAPYREHYIEVKGSSLSRYVFLTANEWREAHRRGDAWEMQVWLIEETDPICLKAVDLELHMPHNQGNGQWVDVRFPTDLLIGRDQAPAAEHAEPVE